MAKSKKFESTHDGAISVDVGEGRQPVQFVPGEVRTYETDDPVEIAALEANPDVSEVKQQPKSSKK